MAMRIYTKEEIESELRKINFSPTDTKTKKHHIWKHEGGKVISFPIDLDEYPDYFLDKALDLIGELHTTPDTSKVTPRTFSKTYKVN